MTDLRPGNVHRYLRNGTFLWQPSFSVAVCYNSWEYVLQYCPKHQEMVIFTLCRTLINIQGQHLHF